MEKVVVCGAGTMGAGIAQVCAAAGCDVWMYDLKTEYAEGGKKRIADGFDRQVAKGKMSGEEKERILDRLHPTVELGCVKDAGVILEAVLEIPEVKKGLYAQLEEICPETALIGTNTSYIPISRLAEGMKHPERFIGMHFFNPVYAMKLVEIIRGEKTDDETVRRADVFAAALGKETVIVRKEVPGFIVNRLNKAMQAEAMRLLHEGVATVEEIDKAAKLGLRYPMGPFEMMDGNLELTWTCMNLLYDLTGEERFRPTPELEAHIKAGDLGRRNGRGWYDYREEKT